MPWWINFIAGIVVGLLAGTVVVFDVLYRPRGVTRVLGNRAGMKGMTALRRITLTGILVGIRAMTVV